jgi:hypothetical protein
MQDDWFFLRLDDSGNRDAFGACTEVAAAIACACLDLNFLGAKKLSISSLAPQSAAISI